VFSRRRGSETLEPFSEWQLTSHSSRDRPREDAGTFRNRLVASVRAGHALGVAFDLRLTSGHDPVLTLGCTTTSGARWVTRILSTAYGRASWVRRTPSHADRGLYPLWGRRVRAWPDPLREPTDGPSAVDGLVLAMKGLAPGVSVGWEFSPCPASWSRPREIYEGGQRPQSSRPIRRLGESRPSTRRSETPTASGSVPLFWRASVGVTVRSGGASRSSDETVPSAVEVALRSGKGNGVRFPRSRLRLPNGKPWFAVSEEELSCILPGADGEVGPADPRGVEGLPVLPLGRSTTGRVVGPRVEPGQGRHLAVLGETGMGKSSTLVAVARKASTVGGVVLFDPLGETARSFLSGLSAEERSRLVWVTPRDPACGINALEGIGRSETDPVLWDRRLNDLVSALRRVRSGRYVDSSYWGPRLEEMLTRAIGAAAAFPDGTLADAHTLLATGGRTRQVVPPGAQEAVRELSDRIRNRPDDAEGARRLLYEVVRSPVLHRMLCERRPSLHAKDLVEPGRIAVISGDASVVGESVARYLLAVYLALVWAELLARGSNPKVFVVLDESQWFSHESLAEMLRLARRRNVHIVLATQTVGSLPEAVAEAVWTNVSDFVAFRGSPEEARELSRASHGVSVEEIMALPRGHAAVLLGKGNTVDWLRTAGRPPTLDLPLDEKPGGPPLPDPGTGGADNSDDGSSPTVEKVLAWILAKARTLTAGEPLRVELADLRKTVDPGGRAIRGAGARLGRAGALISCERSAAGSVWVLDPERIRAGLGSTGPASPPGSAQAPQPS